MHSRVEFIVAKLDTTLGSKLTKAKLMTERKRKLVIYNVAGDGAIAWDACKKRRANLYSGTGPGFSESRAKSVLGAYEAIQVSERDDAVSQRNVLACLSRVNTNRAAKGANENLRKIVTDKFSQTANVTWHKLFFACVPCGVKAWRFTVSSEALVDPEPTDLLARPLDKH